MKANRFIIIFLLKAIGVYASWYVIYDLWLKKVGTLDNWIVDSIVYFSSKILTSFNYMIYVDNQTIGIYDAASNVFVGTGCNGLEMMVLFVGFVLIFDGSWKHKIWFIPAGIIILHILNIARVLSLIFIGKYFTLELLEFNHKYTFTIILYVITFFGWMIWVKYFSQTNSNIKKDVKSK
ncbi:MAG: hypothetical protein COB15_04015 [Flavobacteriales bacterium]|nr:MAG: hypothetical protein COB15_04015 [Flavobacteriales bacterium]